MQTLLLIAEMEPITILDSVYRSGWVELPFDERARRKVLAFVRRGLRLGILARGAGSRPIGRWTDALPGGALLGLSLGHRARW